MTDHVVRIGNVVDLTGPTPQRHAAAQQAVGAFVAYTNGRGARLCGRQLRMVSYDARTETSGDEAAYAMACRQTLAVVGSNAEYDDGGAGRARECGLPDLRSRTRSMARSACGTCFAIRNDDADETPAAIPDRVVDRFPDPAQRTAFVYIDDGTSEARAVVEARGWNRRGAVVRVLQRIDISEFNYVPYVRTLAETGIGVVRFVGDPSRAVRFAQAMEREDYRPALFLLDVESYTEDFLTQAGSAAVRANTQVATDAVPFEEADDNSALRLYVRWLEQTSPGSRPTVDGLYAWSAASLFFQRARALGGDLTRQNLLHALRDTGSWDGGGLHSARPVGAGRTPACWRFVRATHDGWVPTAGRAFRCGPRLPA